MATDQRAMEAEEEARRAELLAELDSRIKENLDGTMIVTLACPVGDTERVTVRRVNVGDVRACRGVSDAPLAYALRLVSPQGVIDKLEAELDYEVILRAVDRVLGKYRSAGRRS